MNLDDREKLLKSRSRKTTVDVQTTSTQLIAADPNRIAITFSAPPTNRYTLNIRDAAVLDQGITIYPAQMPVTFTIAQHGDAVRGAWIAISAVANQNVSCIDTTLIH